MHDSILSSPAVEIDPRLVVSGLLFDSGSGLHHQQDRLLQQSPGRSRQISSEQATINSACSCSSDHAEKDVRPDLVRHPRQAPLASCWAKDPIQDRGVGLLMSSRERSILPVGDAQCIGGWHWSSIASISCPWWLGHTRTRTLGYDSRMFAISGPTFWNSLPLRLRDISLSMSSGDSWKPSCLEMHMALTC